jgi:hypothetical protein
MKAGEISGNTSSTHGGGVYVNSIGSSFTMEGGKIFGNTASNHGGGVRVYNGTFVLLDGEIYTNIGNNGGGVAIGGGNITMYGGKIYGNTGKTHAGGVYVADVGNSVFTMHNGEIFGNTTVNNGGGVRVYGGTFTMLNGKIFGNSAANGGGMGVTGGTLIIQNGEIYGNTASLLGGGVYMGSVGTFKKELGGIIYGNVTPNGNAVKNSGGVLQADKGHAVYRSATQKREKTVGAAETLDSGITGAGGGWVE